MSSYSCRKAIFVLLVLANFALAHANQRWVLSKDSYQVDQVKITMSGDDLFLSAGEHATVKLSVDKSTLNMNTVAESSLVLPLTHDGHPCAIHDNFKKCQRVIAILALDSRGPGQLRPLENIIRRKHLVSEIVNLLESKNIEQHFAVVEFDQV